MSGPSSFSIDAIPPGTHVCYLYDSPDQRLDAMGRILSGVLRSGGSTGYFACGSDLDVIRDHLVQRGVPRDLLEEPRFTVSDARALYAPEGRFSRPRMLDRLRDAYRAQARQTAGTVFFTGEMEWALQPGLRGGSDLVAYEQEVNAIIVDNPFSAICQYDARLFDGALLFQILKAHPLMLVRNQIVANPYYEPPAAGGTAACCGGADHDHA